MTLNTKTITALVALVGALSGAVELRVQVGMMSSRLDRIEQRLDRINTEELHARAD